jgi:hypothetical protein
MESKSINILEIINECCLILCASIITGGFTDYNVDSVKWIGWVYIVVAGVLMIYAVATVLVEMFIAVIEKI